jgi:hypothetical protein
VNIAVLNISEVYVAYLFIPTAVWSKAQVCVRLRAGIAGSNLAESVDVRLLCLLGVV